MLVSDILKNKGSDVIVIEPTDSVYELAQLLRKHAIGAAVVLGEGRRIAGIVSERDVVYAIATHGQAAVHMPIRKLMSTTVAVCSRDDDIKHVMVIMTHRRVRHLPVVDNRALTGIVSIGDLVKARLEERVLKFDVLRDLAQAHVA